MDEKYRSFLLELELEPLQGYMIIADKPELTLESLIELPNIETEAVELPFLYRNQTQHQLWDFLKKQRSDHKKLFLFHQFGDLSEEQAKDLTWHMDIFQRPEIRSYQEPNIGSVFIFGEAEYRLYLRIKDEMPAIRPIFLRYNV